MGKESRPSTVPSVPIKPTTFLQGRNSSREQAREQGTLGGDEEGADVEEEVSGFTEGKASEAEEQDEVYGFTEYLQQVEADLVDRRSIVVRELQTKLSGKSNVPWVDLMVFNLLVAGALCSNAVLLGIEVDTDLGEAGFVLHSMFTCLWLIEVAARMYAYGLIQYLKGPWNLFDLFVALLCVFDVWIFPFVFVGDAGLTSVTIARVVRALRVVRVVRSLRLFHDLWLLATGLAEAVIGLIWVFVLIFVVIYSFGIVMTYIVGRGCETGDYAKFEDCEKHFGTLYRSMLTLFSLMTMEMEDLREVGKVSSLVLFLLLFFMMLTSFGLVNIITGVIVEKVLKTATLDAERNTRMAEKAAIADLKLIRDVFVAADKDCSGTVCLEEFLAICRKDPVVRRKLEDLSFPVSHESSARRLYEVLDIKGKSEMGIDAFIERCATLKKEGKMMASDMTIMLMDVRHNCRRLDTLEADVHSVQKSVTNIDKKLEALADGIRTIDRKLNTLVAERDEDIMRGI